MPYRRIAADALAAWREADRRLAAMDPSHDAWQATYLEAELAKATYQEAVDAARREQLPEPPPFDEVTGQTDRG